MSTVWIMVNSLDLQSFLILILVKLQLKDNNLTTFTQKFKQAIAIINLAAIVPFIEAI